MFLPAEGEDEDAGHSEEEEKGKPPVDIFLLLEECRVVFCRFDHVVALVQRVGHVFCCYVEEVGLIWNLVSVFVNSSQRLINSIQLIRQIHTLIRYRSPIVPKRVRIPLRPDKRNNNPNKEDQRPDSDQHTRSRLSQLCQIRFFRIIATALPHGEPHKQENRDVHPDTKR